MNYIEKKLLIPKDKNIDSLSELFLQVYQTTPMHWDDTEKTRMRPAQLSDGSIAPTPELDEEGNETGFVSIVALWPESFFNDIYSPSETLPLEALNGLERLQFQK